MLFRSRRYSEDQISRLGIGRKFQTPRVYLNLTARENLELAASTTKNVWGTLFKQISKIERDRVWVLLETIGLVVKADRQASFASNQIEKCGFTCPIRANYYS